MPGFVCYPLSDSEERTCYEAAVRAELAEGPWGEPLGEGGREGGRVRFWKGSMILLKAYLRLTEGEGLEKEEE